MNSKRGRPGRMDGTTFTKGMHGAIAYYGSDYRIPVVLVPHKAVAEVSKLGNL